MSGSKESDLRSQDKIGNIIEEEKKENDEEGDPRVVPPQLKSPFRKELDRSEDIKATDIQAGLRSYIAETIGWRHTQEDAYMFAAARQRRNRSEAQAFLMDAFTQIDRLTRERLINGDEIKNGGATANVVYISGDGVTVANLGDSRTWAVKRNTKTGKIWLGPLSEDHKPGSESEKKRITDLGGKVFEAGIARVSIDGVSNSGLSVSR